MNAEVSRAISMKLPVAFLLGVLASVASVAADENPCSGLNKPTVEVVSRLITPQLNLQTPAEQLTLAAQTSRPGETDGLTDFQVIGELTLQEGTTPGGCPVRAIQAVIKQSRLEVYIAKEVSPASCRFRAVYDHELKHVLLAQRSIDRSVSPLRKQLTAAVAGLSTQDTRDVASLRVALMPVLSAYLGVLTAEYSRGNAELDTPEEALRLDALCQDPQNFAGNRSLTEEARRSAR